MPDVLSVAEQRVVHLTCDNSMEIKAFISYSSKDKKYGAAVRTALSEVNLESFLAHDDLRVSEEWKARILAEL